MRNNGESKEEAAEILWWQGSWDTLVIMGCHSRSHKAPRQQWTKTGAEAMKWQGATRNRNHEIHAAAEDLNGQNLRGGRNLKAARATRLPGPSGSIAMGMEEVPIVTGQAEATTWGPKHHKAVGTSGPRSWWGDEIRGASNKGSRKKLVSRSRRSINTTRK